MAAKVDRGQAKVAPKGRPGTPRGTQGRPKKDEKQTHELDESSEGTTHDHRSLRRDKRLRKITILYCVFKDFEHKLRFRRRGAK